MLGCTHYPLLRDVIARVAAELAGRADRGRRLGDRDGARPRARRSASGAEPARTRPGRLDCFATDTSRLDELAPRFLGEPLTGFELVDLVDATLERERAA